MLKKLDRKFTKSVFYLKNNFLSILFKLCVITTLSILIYLVCILKKTDTAAPNEHINAYPIENSQKLMLTTSTEMTLTLDSPSSTTEALTTIKNLIPKTEDYIGTHPLFPLQEQTTTPMVPDEATTQWHELETTPETSVDADTKPTIPFKRSLSTDELLMWMTTTEGLSRETILEPEEQIEENEEEKEEEKEEEEVEQKEEEQKEVEQEEEQKEEEQEEEQIVEEEQKEDQEDKDEDVNVLTPTTTDSPHLIVDSTTVSSTPRADDLFMDNWANYLTTEQYYSQLHQPGVNSFELEPAESIFLNEDNEFGTLEAPIPENGSEDSLGIHVEELIPYSEEGIKPTHDVFKMGKTNEESIDNKQFSLELPPFLSPTNLFNLFTLDHLPAASDMKRIVWPKTKKAPASAGKSVRSRKRHANSAGGGPNNPHQLDKFRGIDTLLNMKLKDSVNLFGRLFGNFHQ